MMQTRLELQTDIEMIRENFKGKDIISFDQFSVEDLRIVFDLTHRMKDIVVNNEPSQLLAGMVVALLFFEPSSRTFGSFSSAIKRLGGQSIDMLNPETVASMYKGETFEDTIRVLEAYSDAIVLRHHTAGAARVAAQAAE